MNQNPLSNLYSKASSSWNEQHYNSALVYFTKCNEIDTRIRKQFNNLLAMVDICFESEKYIEMYTIITILLEDPYFQMLNRYHIDCKFVTYYALIKNRIGLYEIKKKLETNVNQDFKIIISRINLIDTFLSNSQ